MPRIILKSPYLKPNASAHLQRYIKYIATREGVECAENSKKYLPVTESQAKIIEKLLSDYPDSKELFEYGDYKNEPNRGHADELIMRIAETHAQLFGDREKYVKYIAQRLRVEKISSHGLFSDAGKAVILADVGREVAENKSNVWTHIISLKCEDAERLGYNSADAWMNLLRSQRNMIAKNMKISPENFRWYAAFHNEGHHPHVHMIAYSTKPNEAYLSENGIENIKSSLAKVIFRQDLISIYEKQTQYRDELRQSSKDLIAEIVVKINSQSYENPQVEELLLRLAERFKNTSSKKVYGYLKPDVKAMVDEIVREISSDENIAKLYNLWYEQRENVLKTYTDDMPPRIDLVDNKEFKSLKNAVIKEAMNIVRQSENAETDDFSEENTADENSGVEDVDEGNLDERLFYEPPDDSYAEPSETWQAEQKNIQKSLAAKGALRLFRDICNTVQTRIADENTALKQRVDKKLYRRIQEKKHEQGLH